MIRRCHEFRPPPPPPLEYSDTVSLRRNSINSASHPHRIDFTRLFLPETVFRRRTPEDEDRYACSKNGRRHHGRKSHSDVPGYRYYGRLIPILLISLNRRNSFWNRFLDFCFLLILITAGTCKSMETRYIYLLLKRSKKVLGFITNSIILISILYSDGLYVCALWIATISN